MNRLALGIAAGLLAAVACAGWAFGQDGVPPVCQKAMDAMKNKLAPEARAGLWTQCLETKQLDSAKEAIAFHNRGNDSIDLGQTQRAIQDFDQAIRRNLQYASAYLSRGSAYGNLGQHRRALQDFEQAIRINPKFAHAYVMRAFAYKYLGQIDQAKADVRKAKELDPKISVPGF